MQKFRTVHSALFLSLLFSGCGKKKEAEPASQPPANASSWWRPLAPTPAPPAEIWKEFSGDKAFAHVKRLTEFGPRPIGSEALEATRKYLIENLETTGWRVERQTFFDQTPRGKFEFVNLIARFSGQKGGPASTTSQKAIVASHYDTKIFDTIRFVGASDGASSTGALLELARVLALDPELARRVELVLFDGEEAVSQFSETDGLYGSRFFARNLRETKRNAQFQFGILWDMIGDADLTLTLSPDSPPELARSILEASEALGMRKHFSYFNRSIWDDHVPLNAAHIPTIDLIDFDYLYWHTADDTLDKLSADSLQKVGAITLYHLRNALRK